MGRTWMANRSRLSQRTPLPLGSIVVFGDQYLAAYRLEDV